MRDLFFKLFGSGNASTEITLFSIWHILYFVLIVGLSIGGAFILKNKSDKAKKITLSVLAIALVISYLSDFFIQPFYSSDGEMIIDKLPFHICTVLCPFVAFCQFNKKFSCLRETVASLSIVASLMYITYPGSALGGVAPWSYQVVQTFFYHGVLFAWGFLAVATKSVTLNFKNIWQPLVGIGAIALWATLGNSLYSSEAHHYDWFFLTGSTFPFIPSWLMPIVVIVAVFGMVALIYTINLVVNTIIKKHRIKKGIVVEETMQMTIDEIQDKETAKVKNYSEKE